MPTYDFVIAGLLGRLGEPRETATQTFVSFNYDLLVDETLSKLDIPFSYGFETGQVTIDPSAHRLTLSDTPEVLLLKLHGSTNCSLSIAREDQLRYMGRMRTSDAQVVRRNSYRPPGESRTPLPWPPCGTMHWLNLRKQLEL